MSAPMERRVIEPNEARAAPLPPVHLLPPGVWDGWLTIASMPYENLTKVVKYERVGRAAERSLRLPDEVLIDQRRYGTGGTCFALVYLFYTRLRAAGVRARLVTADRAWGPDTHSAVVVDAPPGSWVFDPGYMVAQPLPEEGELKFRSPVNPNASKIVAAEQGRAVCYTGHAGRWRVRYTLKLEPLDEQTYKGHWAASFAFEMMDYPVLNRYRDGAMLYLQKSGLFIREAESSSRIELAPDELPELVRRHYGIDPRITAEALRVMGR